MQTSERVGEKGSAWTPRPTLTGSDYTSIEVWEEERERIWWGDWVCVGRTEEIPEPGISGYAETGGETGDGRPGLADIEELRDEWCDGRGVGLR